MRTFRPPFAWAITPHPNRSEGLLGDVSFQAPNAVARPLLQAYQPGGGFRKHQLPGAGIGHLLASELGLEEAEAVPGVFRAGVRLRHAPQVVVVADIAFGHLDRSPPGEVV